jgi:hypothetical protein
MLYARVRVELHIVERHKDLEVVSLRMERKHLNPCQRTIRMTTGVISIERLHIEMIQTIHTYSDLS